MPRLFNYVFNPLSVYFCWRPSGELAALVYEVSNTFGERHFYAMTPISGADGKVTADGFTFSGTIEFGGSTIDFFVKGTVSGNQISGTIDSPQGTAAFSGTRNP